jgi:hypothetical protein
MLADGIMGVLSAVLVGAEHEYNTHRSGMDCSDLNGGRTCLRSKVIRVIFDHPNNRRLGRG